MYFRPLPVLTLLALPILVLLLWLGSWQLGRMEEKADAIAAWESREGDQVAELEAALCANGSSPVGRSVIAPEPVNDSRFAFQGRSANGEPGWRIMAAISIPDCFEANDSTYALIQTGFETLRGERSEVSGPVRIETLPEAGPFTAANTPETHEYYRFDADLFEAELGVSSITDQFWLIETSEGLPPELAATPPSQHLGYALTWFGMAIVLIIFYGLMHMRAGRLSFTRR